MKRKTAILLLLFVGPCCSQGWEREEKTDPLRGTQYVQFSLEGKFLTPPQFAAKNAPQIIVQCIPGKHGDTNGRFLGGSVYVGSVLNDNVNAQFRLDGGGLRKAEWYSSSEMTSLMFSPGGVSGWQEFATLLYGKPEYHKENSGSQTTKAIIGVQEAFGREVVMEFFLSDATKVAEECGIISHKKKGGLLAKPR